MEAVSIYRPAGRTLSVALTFLLTRGVVQQTLVSEKIRETNYNLGSSTRKGTG